MRFDIKKWQDKHLIEESKLKKEIDFKSQKAFQKYEFFQRSFRDF